MSVVDSLTRALDVHRAKKARWDTLISLFLKFPENERAEFIGKLVTLEFDDDPEKTFRGSRSKSGMYSLFPLPDAETPANVNLLQPAGPQPSPISRDWEVKPRYSDLIRMSIETAGRALTSHEIVKFATDVRPDVKKTSMETVISRMMTNKELKKSGANEDGLKLYDLPHTR